MIGEERQNGSAAHSILLLTDDEPEQSRIMSILDRGQCHVQVANDDEAALLLIGCQQYDAVFCHLRSGAFNSANFLSEVWKRRPQSARFLLARQIDAETQMRCAFAGHQFLELPLDSEAVAAAMDQTRTRRVILQNDRIETMLSRIRIFPSKPALYAEVLQELASDNPSVTAIGDLIAKDLGIATKLIQLVNSPFYGQSQPIDNLTEAVLILGLEITGAVVLSLEAISRFEKVKQKHFSPEAVWKHSSRIAEISREIAQVCHPSTIIGGYSYLAGLLHDIGKLALAQNFPDEYQSVIAKSQQTGCSLFVAEHELLGVSHPEAGAYILALWGLPRPIIEAVAAHHSAPQIFSEEFTPAVALHLSEQLLCGGKRMDSLLAQYPSELGLRNLAERLSQVGG